VRQAAERLHRGVRVDGDRRRPEPDAVRALRPRRYPVASREAQLQRELRARRSRGPLRRAQPRARPRILPQLLIEPRERLRRPARAARLLLPRPVDERRRRLLLHLRRIPQLRDRWQRPLRQPPLRPLDTLALHTLRAPEPRRMQLDERRALPRRRLPRPPNVLVRDARFTRDGHRLLPTRRRNLLRVVRARPDRRPVLPAPLAVRRQPELRDDEPRLLQLPLRRAREMPVDRDAVRRPRLSRCTFGSSLPPGIGCPVSGSIPDDRMLLRSACDCDRMLLFSVACVDRSEIRFRSARSACSSAIRPVVIAWNAPDSCKMS
jgi:hypothetical protein